MPDDAIPDAISLLERSGYVVRPAPPKCRNCSDSGHYTIWSGRGEKADVYCSENCPAAVALKEADSQASMHDGKET
jgi:hypothetical protein